jgi:hypothetical protein
MCISQVVNIHMDGWMDGWMDRWMDEWMDGWMDRWMDRWMDGWIDGWMDGWVDAVSGTVALLDCQSCRHAGQLHKPKVTQKITFLHLFLYI